MFQRPGPLVPYAAALAAVLIAPAAALAAGSSKSTFETIVKDVVVEPGKAIVKAAKSAVNDLETGSVEKRKAKSKSSKSAKTDNERKSDDPPLKSATDKSDKKPGVRTTGKKLDRPTRAEGRSAPAPSAKSGAFPKTLEDAKAEAEAAQKPPPAWTPEEIADAKSRCTAILQRISAVAIPEPPIREGSCGAPAPIQLVSIGKNPEVALSPPAVLTCELAEALDTWMKNDIQPLAKKHLGAEVIKIETMSSYACRNAYGRVGSKLSEHGLANALDIRGFVTSSAKTAYLLEDWGVTQREINAQIAAAKAAAEKAEAERLAAEKAAQDNLKADKGAPAGAPPAATASTTAGAPASGLARGSVVDGVPKTTVILPGAAPKKTAEPSLSIVEPSHLGAPKLQKLAAEPDRKGKANVASQINKLKGEAAKSLLTKTAGVQITVGIPTTAPPPGVKGEFLRKAHAAACRIFGTTLGPEANAAHRNHFHVDMAPRKHTKICD